MSRCEQVQEQISRLLDGDLSPQEQAAVQEHIAGCAECAALYEAFSAVSDAIGQDLEEAPDSLRETVMAEIRREEIRRRNQSLRPWRRVLTAAACLVLLVGLGYGLSPLRGAKAASQSANVSMSAASAGSFAESRDRSLPAEAYEEAEEASAAAEAPAANDALALAPAADQARAAMVYDLSQRLTTAQLVDFLGASPCTTDAAEPPEADLLCTVTTSDGSVSLFQTGGKLLYTAPGAGTQEAQCTVDELLAFLTK